MSQLPRTSIPPKPRKRVWTVYWYDHKAKDDKVFQLEYKPKIENGVCSFTFGAQDITLGGNFMIVESTQ